MNKILKLIATLFFTFAIVALMLPGPASAAAPPASVYPNSIAGLPVILVETSANNISLQEGHVTLVLLDTVSLMNI